MAATRTNRRDWLWPAIALAAIAALSFSATARAAGQRLFTSLRIAKPKPVTVTTPSFSGPNANRQLQDAISGMISGKVRATVDEADQPAANAEAAARLAGFAAQFPRARKDPPTLIVMGAHAADMAVDRTQLRTMFTQAGRSAVALPPSLDGTTVTLKTPRAIRAQYGNCPAPAANTLQNQIQGPPPPTTDNGNCVVLTQSPAASAEVPGGLDVDQLVEIALELSGMSPNQAQEFQETLDWKSTLVLSMPRAMRSYQAVDVNGVRGMLVNTAGRRGPTWALIWAKNGIVYSLAGYGSAGDAVPLANSLN
jgi:hypothetical protein